MAKLKSATKKDRTIEHEYDCYQYRAYPNDSQKVYLSQVFGCTRFLWNKYVGDERDFYQLMGTSLGNTPSDYKEDYPFLKEVDSLALCNVQLDYQTAMSAFFAGTHGYPKFKKKGRCRDSYTTNVVNGNIALDTNQGILKLPKLPGKFLKLVLHRLPENNLTLKKVTVSCEHDGSYYVSLCYEREVKTKPFVMDKEDIKLVGLDMSMKELFLSSDGEYGDYPRFYRRSEEKLAKEQRKLSRMVKDSKNYEKQKAKIARLHAHIKFQRKDFLHKLSTDLVNRYDVIVIEDLNMQAMSQGLHFGKSVHDNGWGMFVSMLEYKARKAGKLVVKVDRWYPSSQTCSVCGYINKDVKSLSVREWYCSECGTYHDRDLNAAINIAAEGMRVLLTNNMDTAA